MNLARGVARAVRKQGDGDPAFPFAPVRDRIETADVAFANLECVLSNQMQDKKDGAYVLHTHPDYVNGLSAVGFDLLSVANNHMLDLGVPGLEETLATLTDNDLIPVGEKLDGEAQAPEIVEVKGHRIAFLAWVDHGGFSDDPPTVHRLDVDQAVEDVTAAAAAAHHVIVSLHWGDEYNHKVQASQRAVAKRLVDAGADVIVGHGPHVPQRVERMGDAVVAYSVGDLVFDKTTPFKRPRTRRSFFLDVRLGRDGPIDFELVPLHQNNSFQSRVDTSLDVQSFLEPPPASDYVMSEKLPEASVVRVTKSGDERCDRWLDRAPHRRRGYHRWLAPRWACGDDKQRPWLTVAATTERSASVLKDAVWAHPHPGGPLRITFQDVPLARGLVGHAGFSDHVARIGRAEQPVAMKVLAFGEELFAGSFPYRRGWQELRVPAPAGKDRGDVVVEIGPAGSEKEAGFLFNLWSPRAP